MCSKKTYEVPPQTVDAEENIDQADSECNFQDFLAEKNTKTFFERMQRFKTEHPRMLFEADAKTLNVQHIQDHNEFFDSLQYFHESKEMVNEALPVDTGDQWNLGVVVFVSYPGGEVTQSIETSFVM